MIGRGDIGEERRREEQKRSDMEGRERRRDGRTIEKGWERR